MKCGVVVFPGSNCDEDAVYALSVVLRQPVVRVWHKDTTLQGVDLVVLPGGFSYGDYLRCGAIARFSPIMEAVYAHARRGGKVFGICNGFQILTEAGLLPGALLRNASMRFLCTDVVLRVANASAPTTAGLKVGERLRMPVAHAEGNYSIDEEGLRRLEGEGRVAFRYEQNPNGSMSDIAGVLNDGGNVLGMMPHPERAIEAVLGSEDGLRVLSALLS